MTDENALSKQSSHLYQVLEMVGASEAVRSAYRERAIVYELSWTALGHFGYGGHLSAYQFGSICEGTTTHGLQSDADTVVCDESNPVVESVEDAPQHGHAFFMVADVDTRPGYVLLQHVVDGVPQTTLLRESLPNIEEVDQLGRIFRRHMPISFIDHVREVSQNGPAFTYSEIDNTIQLEWVPAFRCQKIPSAYDSWVHRDRKWPSQSQIKKMEMYGCFVVGIGHPLSQRKSVEWRISFSLQERDLMFSLNPTQHRCYILLKMIKKDIIHPRAGKKSISSYHCKTCLFHFIETKDHFDWSARNLILATRLCLELMLLWVRKGTCPNYFIPSENMFERVGRDSLTDVRVVLEDILGSDDRYLLTLNCDHVGTLLNKSLSGLGPMELRKEIKISPESKIHIGAASTLFRLKYSFLDSFCNASALTDYMTQALELLQYLTDFDCVTEHTEEDIRMTRDAIVPDIHLEIAQCIASSLISYGDAHHPYITSANLVYHILKGQFSDRMSSQLILATWFLRTEKLDFSEHLLLACEDSVTPYLISMRGCQPRLTYSNIIVDDILLTEKLSIAEFRRQCTASCITFLNFQSSIVPPALLYEMYRSVFTKPETRNESNAWFDRMAVDSRVYLFFLQYILYRRLNKTDSKLHAIDSLADVVITDDNLGHTETGYNLLGWVYSQEGRPREAWKCFCRSWRMVPQHNAAKWHMVVILHTLLE